MGKAVIVNPPQSGENCFLEGLKTSTRFDISGAEFHGNIVIDLDALTSGFSGDQRIDMGGNDLTLNMPLKTNGSTLLRYLTNCRKLKIKLSDETTSLYYVLARYASEVSITDEIILDFSTANVTDFSYAFMSQSKVKKISGVIDMSSCINDISLAMLYSCESLEEIRFAENTIKVSGVLRNNTCKFLSEESIISIANGLNEFVTGKNIAFHSDVVSKCNLIMGSVSLDETETFHIFTADDGGTTSLYDFITITKGWTIG